VTCYAFRSVLSTFTKYHTINFPETRRVRYYYANDAALQAAKAGKSLPDGSILFAEVFAAKLDADKKPLTASDGFLEPGELLFYTAMGREGRWGKDIPDMCATRTGIIRCSQRQRPIDRSTRPNALPATSRSTR
jgi:hypothetical protein